MVKAHINMQHFLVLVASITVVVATAAVGVDFIPVPGGQMRHRSCIHEVASGTRIHEADDGMMTVTEPGKPPRILPTCNTTTGLVGRAMRGSAWKTWAQLKPGDATSVTALSNQWKVPPNPTKNNNQVLYYWNGVEDGGSSGGTGVLQPVLQFGQSTPNAWGIKSWYVGSGGTVTSPVVKLKTGDIVTGKMAQQLDGSWICIGVAEFNSGNWSKASTLHYTGTNEKKFTYAYTAVLEAYHVYTDASEYPSSGSVAFTKTQLEFDGVKVSPPFQWDNCFCPDPSCGKCEDPTGGQLGEKTTTSDNGENVTIHWNTAV